MKNKYKKYNILNNIFLLISLIFIIIDRFLKEPKIWLLTIYFWLAILFYTISLIFFFIKSLKYEELEAKNPIEAYKFAHEYYDKIGYSLFTGGIIVLFSTSEIMSSLGLIIIGFTCIVISLKKKRIHEKITNDFKKINSSN